MEVSGQLQSPAALSPVKEPRYQLDRSSKEFYIQDNPFSLLWVPNALLGLTTGSNVPI